MLEGEPGSGTEIEHVGELRNGEVGELSCNDSSSPPFCFFTFCDFSYLMSTKVKQWKMEDSRNKQFISFKLPAILSNMMKLLTILPRPT